MGTGSTTSAHGSTFAFRTTRGITGRVGLRSLAGWKVSGTNTYRGLNREETNDRCSFEVSRRSDRRRAPDGPFR